MDAKAADADQAVLAAAGGDPQAVLEIRLREAEHRLTNILQLIASLLQLQARRATSEAQAALLAAADRVSAIGALHNDLLAASGAIALSQRFEAFLDLQRRIAPDTVQLSFSAATECHVPSEMAVSLMLVVNELVTNALQHAFPDGRAGTITLRLDRTPDKYLIAIADNGVGTSWPPRSFGFGSRMVNGLAGSIGGEVVAVPVETGTRLEVRFPAPDTGAEP